VCKTDGILCIHWGRSGDVHSVRHCWVVLGTCDAVRKCKPRFDCELNVMCYINLDLIVG